MRRRLLALCLALPPAAAALCPDPPAKACAAWFRSDEVFLGTVVRVRYVHPDREVGQVVYTVAVEHMLKGTPASVKHVSSEHASARWGAAEGERLVVFSDRGEVGASCSYLDDALETERVLREIDGIRAARDASIEGVVFRFAPAGREEAEGVALQVRASTTGQVYTAVTDAEGRFAVRVPPGRYALRSHRRLRPNLESHDLAGIVVRAGECAQISLESRR